MRNKYWASVGLSVVIAAYIVGIRFWRLVDKIYPPKGVVTTWRD